MGACMSKKTGVDATPIKRPISKATEKITEKSPGKIRVASPEFQTLAARIKTHKAACLSQMELASRYEANYKSLFAAIGLYSDEVAKKHYPDTDEFKEYAEATADKTRGLGDLHAQSIAATQSYKRITDQYRKYLAEITAVEGQFKTMEKEKKAADSETKHLAKLESAKAKDASKIETSKSALLVHRTAFEAAEKQLMERMKAIDDKKSAVFKAGHIAMYLGLNELHAGLLKSTESVVRDTKQAAPAFVTLEGEPRLIQLTPKAEHDVTKVTAAPAAPAVDPAPPAAKVEVIASIPAVPTAVPSAPPPPPIAASATTINAPAAKASPVPA